MVVTDPNGDDAYVIMGLDQYERLVLTKTSQEQPILADTSKKNKVEPEPVEEEGRVGPVQLGGARERSFVSEASPADIWEAMPLAGTDAETWDISTMSDQEKVDLEKQFENYQQEKERNAIVPVSSSQQVDAPIKDQKEEEFGEEQFYLEPIE